jgi:hypothetical protein
METTPKVQNKLPPLEMQPNKRGNLDYFLSVTEQNISLVLCK